MIGDPCFYLFIYLSPLPAVQMQIRVTCWWTDGNTSPWGTNANTYVHVFTHNTPSLRSSLHSPSLSLICTCSFFLFLPTPSQSSGLSLHDFPFDDALTVAEITQKSRLISSQHLKCTDMRRVNSHAFQNEAACAHARVRALDSPV